VLAWHVRFLEIAPKTVDYRFKALLLTSLSTLDRYAN